MAASNKSVGLQITLAIFAMLAIIGWVAFYMQFRDLSERQAEFNNARDEKNVADKASKDFLDDIDALGAQGGYTQPDVGRDQQGAANTKLGAMQNDLARVEQKYPLPQKTLAAAIELLLQKSTDLENQIAESDGQLQKDNTTIAGLRNSYQQQVDVHKTARDKAESDLAKLAVTTQEQLDERQETIEQQEAALRDLQIEYDDAKASWESERKTINRELTELIARVDDLRDKLKQATRISFERPDGLVRWVDNTAGLVWVNLGSQDGLRVRMSFSVYRKGHHGVGRRGSEDIKGQIEVTRIIDAHTSEARVLSDDIYDPIAKGDPVYTPLWSPGRTEKFAVVGLVDLDQDGILDRDQFHDLVSNAGARINHEVNDLGERVRYVQFPDEWLTWSDGDPILDSDTKYLIIADIPDPSLALQEDDKKVRHAISAQLDAFRKEARRLGVEEINLNDFLQYVGFTPQRRIYVPGVVDRPFNLRNGAASVGTNEAVKDRSAAGTVSGLYGRSKRLRPQSSSGTTSGAFRKGGGSGY